MRKKFNLRMESIDIEAENFKEARDLDQAVDLGIVEKVGMATWRVKA